MPSVTQTLPSESTWRPCGKTNIPSPKAFTRLPDESNLRIGGRFEPSQLKGWPSFICEAGMKTWAPHRSATHTFVPSRSISTAAVEPQIPPSGHFPKLKTARYGLGAELVGALAWV